MSWINLIWTAVSAVAGGFIGGWTVAWRTGRWQQRVEDRLSACEARLEKGDAPIGAIPVLGARLDAMVEELKGIKSELRAERAMFVTRAECDKRHEG
mgnify:CR=1 FL=1